MSAIVKLKAAIHRGTTDHGGEEGDPSGIVEVQVLLECDPQLIPETVSLLKTRIKDRSPITSLLALDLLDQCMRCNGMDFHTCVMEKALPRIQKMAMPNNGMHPRVQQKAAHLIKYWSNHYTYDKQLRHFVLAGQELSDKKDKGSSAASTPSKIAASAPSSSWFEGAIKALISRVKKIIHLSDLAEMCSGRNLTHVYLKRPLDRF